MLSLNGWLLAVPGAFVAGTAAVVFLSARRSTGPSKDAFGFTDPLAWLRAIPVIYGHLLFPWQWVTSRLLPTDRVRPEHECHQFQIGLEEWTLYKVPMKEADPPPDRDAKKSVHWYLARSPVGASRYAMCVADGQLADDGDLERVMVTAMEEARRHHRWAWTPWAGLIFVASRGDGYYPIAAAIIWTLTVSAVLYWVFRVGMRRQQGPMRPPSDGSGQPVETSFRQPRTRRLRRPPR